MYANYTELKKYKLNKISVLEYSRNLINIDK